MKGLLIIACLLVASYALPLVPNDAFSTVGVLNNEEPVQAVDVIDIQDNGNRKRRQIVEEIIFINNGVFFRNNVLEFLLIYCVMLSRK